MKSGKDTERQSYRGDFFEVSVSSEGLRRDRSCPILTMTAPERSTPARSDRLKAVFSIPGLAICSLLMTGCATIAGSDSQPVAFSSDPQGAMISINGMPQGTTPVTIQVPRQSQDQMVTVEKEGYAVKQFKLEKHIAGITAGNALFGGAIGMVVDMSTGKGMAYQPSVQVKLSPLAPGQFASVQTSASALKSRGAPKSAVFEQAEGPAARLPTGFYAETQFDFDTLDGATVDPQNGSLTLFGHRSGSGAPRQVPYLDYLAAAVESNNPTFSLEWTPDSRRSIERAFNLADQELTNRLAGTTFDASGHLTQRGEWWYRMFGVNVHAGMDKMSAWVTIFPAAGYSNAGRVMKAVDEVERTAGTRAADVKARHDDMSVPQTPLEHLTSIASGLAVRMNEGDNLNTFARAYNGDGEAQQTLLSWIFQGIALAYEMDRYHYSSQFESLKRSGVDYGMAFERTLNQSQDDTIAVQKNAFHSLFNSRSFIHIPPDIMREVLGVAPVVVPVYEGFAGNSLLGKVAFDADVLGKKLMDMPEIKADVPGYRTYFEWRQTVSRAPAAEGHTWFGPDAFELIESSDGGTVRFGKTPVRIYMERYENSPGSSGRQSVEDPELKQYADELTVLYEPLAAKYSVLLDLRESMKVMAVAEWLKQKGIKLTFPAAGRGSWKPPAQYPGEIHMELAVKEARVGEVMSASGGIDYRVRKNWQLIKQRIDEQPGPPLAHGVIIGYDPASGAVAEARPVQAEGAGMPAASPSAADSGAPAANNGRASDAIKADTSADIKISVTPGVFTCYRIDPTKSGCLEIRNNSTRRVRLYVEGLPGVQCTVDAGSYGSIPLAIGPHHLQLVAEDERGIVATIGADIDLTTEGKRILLTGGPH